MSVARSPGAPELGAKIVLPRRPDRFWGNLRRHYVAEDARRWRALAMLTLAEAADWPPDRIAMAFDVSARQVRRGVDDTRRRLRRRFRPEEPGEAALDDLDAPDAAEPDISGESGAGNRE